MILKRNFGQPHLILNSLMADLVNRKPLKPNDGEALWDLISCMQRCQITLSQMGYVNDLNSTSNLLKVQELLPIYFQTGWARLAQTILSEREPTFSDFLNYLESQAEIACNMFGRNIGVSKPNDKPKARSNYMASKSLKCFACDGEHRLFDCEIFKNMSYAERLNVVKTKRLCFRCLLPGHAIHNCRRDISCLSCQSNKHHTFIHTDSFVKSNAATINGQQVYLRIVPVTVIASNGNQVTSLALLDSGSDTSPL